MLKKLLFICFLGFLSSFQPVKSYYIVFENYENSKRIVDLNTYNYVYKNILNKYSYPMSSINKELLDNSKLRDSLFDQIKSEAESEEKIIREKIQSYNPNLDILYVPNIFLEMAFTLAYFTDYDKDKNLFDIPESVKKLKDLFMNGQVVDDLSDYFGSNFFYKFKEIQKEIESVCGQITKVNFYPDISFLDDLDTDKIIENIDNYNNHPFIVYSNFYVNNLIIDLLNANKEQKLKDILNFLIESFQNVVRKNVLTSKQDLYYFLLAGYTIEKNNIFNMENNIFGFDKSPEKKLKNFWPGMSNVKFGVEVGSYYLCIFNLIGFKSFFDFVGNSYDVEKYNKSRKMLEALLPNNQDDISMDYAQSVFFKSQAEIFEKIFDTEFENHNKLNNFYLYRYSNIFENEKGKLDTNFREKFFLNESGQFRSISFANNLFAGMISDPNASTLSIFFRTRRLDDNDTNQDLGILYYISIKKSLIWDKDNIFYIAPFNIITSIFSAGEWFHSRTKISNKDIPDVNYVYSYQLIIRGLYNFLLVNTQDFENFLKDFAFYKEYENSEDIPEEISEKTKNILIDFTKKSLILNPDKLKNVSNILFGDFSFNELETRFNDYLTKKSIIYKNFN